MDDRRAGAYSCNIMTVRRPLSNAMALALCYVLALQTLLASFQMAQAAEPDGLAIICTATTDPEPDGSPGRSHPVEHICVLCPMPMCGGGFAPVSRVALTLASPSRYNVLRLESVSGTLVRTARREPNAARAPPVPA